MFSNPAGTAPVNPQTYFREGTSFLEPPPHLRSRQTGPDEIDTFGRENVGLPSEDAQRIVDAILRLKAHENDKKATAQAKADAAWSAWNQEVPGGAGALDKAEWQEQFRAPKVWIFVERSVAVFMRFISMVPDWFDMKAILPSQQLLINIAKERLKYLLEDDRTKFWPHLEDMFRELFITGNTNVFVGYAEGRVPVMTSSEPPTDDEISGEADAEGGVFDDLMVSLSTFGTQLDDFGREVGILTDTEDPTTGKRILLPNPDAPRLAFHHVPFERVWRDSTGANRYVIWDVYANAGDFREEAEAKGWDMEAVERAISRGPHHSETSLQNIARDKTQGEKGWSGRGDQDFEYAVTMTNFHGTLYDINDKGEVVFRKKYVVVANGELMFDPIDPPFWDGELPLVQGVIARNSQSVYGKSVVGESVELFDLQISMLQQLADAIQMELHPAYEYDRSQMPDENPKSVPLGPGVAYPTVKNNSTSPAISKIAAGSVDGNLINAFQTLFQQLEGITGATQEGGQAPRTRNRMTGSEHAIRDEQSNTLNAHFFNSIDRTLLTPMLRLALLRDCQFANDKEWELWVLANKDKVMPSVPDNLKEKYESDLMSVSKWTAAERYRNIGAWFRFQVKIYGSALQRQMASERWISLLGVVRQSPEMMQMLNLPYILRSYVETIGADPTEAVRGEAMPIPMSDAREVFKGAPPPAPPAQGPGGPPPGVPGFQTNQGPEGMFPPANPLPPL